jgi:hypothetical protein
VLERIQIENLGPIRQAELRLGDLTILVGESGSGKTSVLQAIQLLADVARNDLRRVTFAGHELQRDFGLLLNQAAHGRSLVLRGWSSATRRRRDPDADFECALGYVEADGPYVALLRESVRDPARGYRPQRSTHLDTQVPIRGHTLTPALPRVSSLPAVIQSLVQVPAYADVADWAAYLDTFLSVRTFCPSAETGANLAGALRRLEAQEPLSFRALEAHARESFPHLRSLPVDAAELGLESRDARLRLFLLWAGFTTPEHGTLLLDEPEGAPALAAQVGFLRELSLGRVTGRRVRVVLATRSVAEIDTLDRSEVRTLEKDPVEGTQIREDLAAG